MDRLTDILRTYYGDQNVRGRLVEFLGGTCNQKMTPFYIKAFGSSQEQAIQVSRPEELFRWLDEGYEIERSLWDRTFLVADLDIEYVNFDFPGAAYLDPDRILALQRPVADAVKELLLSHGISALDLLSGRGHHFTWTIRRDSQCFEKLARFGRIPASLEHAYSIPQPPTGETVTPSLGRAFAGLGMILEYFGQQVIALAETRMQIPVQLMEVEVGVGQLGREIVSIDISEYGDPLHTRHVRIPFSAYLKAHRMRTPFGEHYLAGMPPLFQIPLTGMDEPEAARIMRRPKSAASLARSANVTIPDQTGSMENLIAEYLHSPLAGFHEWYFNRDLQRLDESTSAYSRTSLPTLPLCVENVLRHPNDLLLKPAAVQHLVRAFLALGWHPRDIAGLIWSSFEEDHDWGQRWSDIDACGRADFYTRVYAGLVFNRCDSLIDFNCVSHQEKGYCCPYTACSNNLESFRNLLTARRDLWAFE